MKKDKLIIKNIEKNNNFNLIIKINNINILCKLNYYKLNKVGKNLNKIIYYYYRNNNFYFINFLKKFSIIINFRKF